MLGARVVGGLLDSIACHLGGSPLVRSATSLVMALVPVRGGEGEGSLLLLLRGIRVHR